MRRFRQLSIQKLDTRLMFDGEPLRPFDVFDVNNDLNVTALDALLVVNQLTRNMRQGSQGSSFSASLDNGLCSRCDVNQDGRIAPVDALRVINSLRRNPQRVMMRLERDTAPNGTRNDDGITSDLTIEGRVGRDMVLAIDDGVKYFLGQPRNNLNVSLSERSIELNPFFNGNYFRVPEAELRSVLPSVKNGQSGIVKLTLFSERISGNSVTAISFGEIIVRWDAQAPVIESYNHVSGVDQRFVLSVTDHSQLVGLEAKNISFSTQTVPSLDYSLRSLPQETRIDVALSDATMWSNDTLALSARGVIQDIAGNVATLPTRFALTRIDSSGQQIPKNQFADLTAFDTNAFVAVPGQSIRLPSLVDGRTQSLRFPVKLAPVGDAAPVETSVVVRPWRESIGEAFYQVPVNAISGTVTDDFGFLVAKIAVLSGTDSVGIRDGRWEFASFATPVYYRVVADGEAGVVTGPSQVATWSRVIAGEVVPKLPFGRFQFATRDGFSEPRNFAGKIGITDATAIVVDTSTTRPGGFWIADQGKLVRIDGRTGAILDTVDFSPVGFSNDVPLLSVVKIVGLQNVPKDILLPNVDLIVDANSIDGQSLLLVSLSAGGFVVVDPSSAEVVGKLPSVEPETTEAFFLPAIFHPLRRSWISFSQDLTQYRERNVASGALIATKQVAGREVFLQQGVGGVKPGFVWDSLHSRLVARHSLQPINGIIRPTPSIEFDPLTGGLKPVAARDWDFTGLDDDAFVPGQPFTIDGQGRMLSILRSGLVQRFALQTSAAPLLTRIESTSLLGVAANPAIPSANPGQWIELVGVNLRGQSIRFDYDNGSGDLTAVFIGKDELILEDAVDRTRFWVRVPDEARTGSLKLIGTNQVLPLQIVPGVIGIATVAQALGPSNPWMIFNREETESLVLESKASRIDDYRFRIDGINVVRSEVPSIAWLWSVGLNDLPLPRDSVEVISVGGSTTVPATAIALASDPFVASSFTILERAFGASVEYEVGGEPVQASKLVTAGSTLAIEILPRSSAVAGAVYPSAIQFDLITPLEGGGFRYKTVSGVRIDQSRAYRVALPFEFTGGSIAVRGALRGDQRLPIAVAPTVFAATGDSSRSGASILLSGVNLDDATFSIDGIPLIATNLSDFTSLNIDLVRVVVPEEMTVSQNLVISRGKFTANIGTVVPFWGQLPMPVARHGTPTFLDLPSLNPGQAFSLPGNGVSTSAFFESISSPIDQITLARFSPRRESDGSLRTEPMDSRHGIFMYRVSGTDIGTIIPLINELKAPVVGYGTSQQDIEAFGIGLDQRVQMNIAHNIVWGTEDWSVLPRRTYVVPFEGTPVFVREQLPQRATPSFQSPFWHDDSYRLLSNGDDSSLWFDRYSLSSLPDAPLTVSTGWGTTTSAAMPLVPVQWSAEFGTPANPSLPSVNAGQSVTIDLTENQYQSTGGIAFFTSSESEFDSQTVKPVEGWEAKKINRLEGGQGSLTVPASAAPGAFRIGLFAPVQRVQIVPRLFPFSAETPSWGASVRGTGWDATTKLFVGEKEISLRPDEIAGRQVQVQLSDLRFASLSRADFAGGFRVTTEDGSSNVIFLRQATDVQVADLTQAQRQQYGNRLVMRVTGHELNEVLFVNVNYMANGVQLSDSVPLIDVTNNGKSALLVLPYSPVVPTEVTVTRLTVSFGFLGQFDRELRVTLN